MGGVWNTADVISKARMNQKTVLIDTGANINVAVTYAGMLAYCTSTGSGFTIDVLYERNSANTQWNPLVTSGANTFTGTQTMPSLQITQGIEIDLMKRVFEEFFHSYLSAVWTVNDISGANTKAFQDAIGGGYRITTLGTLNQTSSITHNNIRSIDPSNCTIYGILATDSSSNNATFFGINDSSDFSSATAKNIGIFVTAGGAIYLRTADGTTSTQTSTGVTVGANVDIPFKIVCTAANVKLYLISGGVWTLQVTKTTNLPTTKCQPIFQVFNNAVGAVIYGEAKYLKVIYQ